MKALYKAWEEQRNCYEWLQTLVTIPSLRAQGDLARMSSGSRSSRGLLGGRRLQPWCHCGERLGSECPRSSLSLHQSPVRSTLTTAIGSQGEGESQKAAPLQTGWKEVGKGRVNGSRQADLHSPIISLPPASISSLSTLSELIKMHLYQDAVQ